MTDQTSRAARAVLRNAVTWGVAWAVAGGALLATAAFISPDRPVDALTQRLGVALIAAGVWGVRFGVIGAVVGAAFALAVRARYRGRGLADISPFPFALLGAVVGGVGVPLFLQLMNVLTDGAPIAWGLVLDDAPLAAVFGAAAAGGSILLARRVARHDAPDSADTAALGTDSAQRGRLHDDRTTRLDRHFAASAAPPPDRRRAPR